MTTLIGFLIVIGWIVLVSILLIVFVLISIFIFEKIVGNFKAMNFYMSLALHRKEYINKTTLKIHNVFIKSSDESIEYFFDKLEDYLDFMNNEKSHNCIIPALSNNFEFKKVYVVEYNGTLVYYFSRKDFKRYFIKNNWFKRLKIHYNYV